MSLSWGRNRVTNNNKQTNKLEHFFFAWEVNIKRSDAFQIDSVGTIAKIAWKLQIFAAITELLSLTFGNKTNGLLCYP